jgi:hypothetical protein
VIPERVSFRRRQYLDPGGIAEKQKRNSLEKEPGSYEVLTHLAVATSTGGFHVRGALSFFTTVAACECGAE